MTIDRAPATRDWRGAPPIWDHRRMNNSRLAEVG